jgi:large subunit ribosomal protein L28
LILRDQELRSLIARFNRPDADWVKRNKNRARFLAANGIHSGQSEISGKIFLPSICLFEKYYDLCTPFLKHIPMARVCEITGKKVIVGNKVSHSNIKTKRKFYPNLQTKRFFLPEENKWITLKVSTSAIRTISKNGITSVVKEARKKGLVTK